MSDILTSSRLKTARACQREHWLRYIRGYRPIEDAEALRFGTLIHLGLEAWWNATGGDRLLAAMNALEVGGAIDAFELVKAQELIRGYHHRWLADADNYLVLGVEVHFETELRNPATGAASRNWRLGGKVDVIVREIRSGRVLVIEHKTSSEDITPGSDYWRRLRMDGQVSTYYEGCQAVGFAIEGCIYDVLGKPGLRPLKATPEASRKWTQPTKKDPVPRLYANQREHDETVEEYRIRLVESIATDPAGYYQRGEVTRLEDEMAEAMQDTWQVGQQIRESILTKRFPRNPDACKRYGRLCPFFDVCTGAASIDDPLRFTRSDDVHPELAGNTAAQPKEEAAHL